MKLLATVMLTLSLVLGIGAVSSAAAEPGLKGCRLQTKALVQHAKGKDGPARRSIKRGARLLARIDDEATRDEVAVIVNGDNPQEIVTWCTLRYADDVVVMRNYLAALAAAPTPT